MLGFVSALDHGSPVPLHVQLAAIIREQIKSGKITGRVPSILTTAQTYEVGHSTSQRALRTLRDEGLIQGSHGRGYYVVPPQENTGRGGIEKIIQPPEPGHHRH
jgi:GntR family transcriptional regulator